MAWIGDAYPAVLLPYLLTPPPPTPVSTRGTGPTCSMLDGGLQCLSPILSCSLPPDKNGHAILSDLLPVLYYSTPVSCGPHLKLPEDGLSCSFLSISTYIYHIHGFNKFSLLLLLLFLLLVLLVKLGIELEPRAL